MPFFGKKSEKKEKPNEAPSYPRQQMPPPPQVAHHPMPTNPQGALVHNTDQFYYSAAAPHLQSVPNAQQFTVAIPRNDLPGAYDNFCEGFLDGPDFSNRVPDRSIPPAPGSYYFYSHGNGAPAPGMMPSCSNQGPLPPQPMPAPNNACPPPSYDDVMSQEMKKKL